MTDKVRDKALSILLKVYEGAFSNLELNKDLEKLELRPVDRAFITELVYGTITWTLTLDYIIKNFSKVKENKISERIRAILRMGLYQIFFLDKVPNSAACNESVKLAGKYGHEGTKRFVNGLLRNIIRQTNGNLDNIIFPDKREKPVAYLSARYGYQPWIVKKYLKSHSFEFVEDMMKADNTVPDVTIRFNRLRTTKPDLMAALNQSGIDCNEGKICDDAIALINPSSIGKIDAFNKGLFTVQGESSMLVGKILDPKPGETILDMCSAPGGKTTHIAEIMGNEGKIVAADIFPHRTGLVDEACKRLGISIVETVESDGTVYNDSFNCKFDRVLVDAPCSGLGIVRKKPEIKFTRHEEDISELVKIQSKMLQNAARYVKSGGTIVYSTCTILEEENLDIIKAFINENKMFELVDFYDMIPDKLKEFTGLDAKKGYIRLYSNMGNIDGFFIAVLKRREPCNTQK